MSATEELKHEHRLIERMLAILNMAVARADTGQNLPPEFLPRVIDFIGNFADRCHHGKEEENLFPALEKHGMSRQRGPIAVMLMDHEQGRAYVHGMDEARKRLDAGERSALKDALDNARNYTALLRQHIAREDNILFPMADRLLTSQEQQDLLKKFEEVERERIGVGKHEEYIKLVEDLERQLSPG